MSALSPENLIGYVPVILPLVLAVAGWCVPNLARFLALWPRFFVGVRPMFGWQGYFHANSPLYVDHWSKELLEKVSGLPQIFEYLGPDLEYRGPAFEYRGPDFEYQGPAFDCLGL